MMMSLLHCNISYNGNRLFRTLTNSAIMPSYFHWCIQDGINFCVAARSFPSTSKFACNFQYYIHHYISLESKWRNMFSAFICYNACKKLLNFFSLCVSIPIPEQPFKNLLSNGLRSPYHIRGSTELRASNELPSCQERLTL